MDLLLLWLLELPSLKEEDGRVVVVVKENEEASILPFQERSWSPWEQREELTLWVRKRLFIPIMLQENYSSSLSKNLRWQYTFSDKM